MLWASRLGGPVSGRFPSPPGHRHLSMGLRVCYLGTYEADYDRNVLMIEALRGRGHEVITCHVPLLEGTRHKTGALLDPRGSLRLFGATLRAYLRLARLYAKVPDHDVVVVGYLGHLDMLVAKPLAWLRGKKVIFDAFISLHDTLVEDRRLFRRGSWPAKACLVLDKVACALADRVVLDTQAHARYFVDALGVAERKVGHVPVGATAAWATRSAMAPKSPGEARGAWEGSDGERFVVLHYAKFSPLHGLPHILTAAKLLEDDPAIHFLLVGGGQGEEEVTETITRLELRNVERRAWMDPEELRETVATAGACLGIFGDSGKASRVIPNKVYQCMAGGGAIITGDTPAARELLVPEVHAILVPVADGAAMARAVRRLRGDPALRRRLQAAARARFEASCSLDALGRSFESLVRGCLGADESP